MIEKDTRFERVASSICDGSRVEWESVEASANDPAERAYLRNLRALYVIAGFHRDQCAKDAERSPTLTTEVAPSAIATAPVGLDGLPLWGHLALIEKVGQGGFGEVWRAWDRRLDSEVALKLLAKNDPDDARTDSSVIEEGRLLARARHPHVVAVYGAEQHGGRIGIWMEFLRGRTLAQLIEAQGPFGAREASVIGIDLCRALAAVHNAGIVHRDVKAGNVMRVEGGRIVLMDFGIGRDAHQASRESDRSISGTPLYMAPEVLHGGQETIRSDIYSLGVLLYQLVTGSFPVKGRSLTELRAAHERQQTRLLRDARPDLPEAFVQAVERSLCRESEGRFTTTGQMEQALAMALGVESHETSQRSAPPPEGGLNPERRHGRFHIALAAGSIVAVATLVTLAAFVLKGRTTVTERLNPSTRGNISVPPSEPQEDAGVQITEPGRQPVIPTISKGDQEGTIAGTRKLLQRAEDLAALHEAMGNYAEAQALYERILATKQRLHRAEDTSIADTLVRLAWILQVQGSPAEARNYYTRALRIYEKAPGLGNPNVDATLTALASLDRQLGHEEAAEEMAKRAAGTRHLPNAPSGSLSLASLSTSLQTAQEPYTVEAALHRRLADRDERLAPGQHVGPGDEIWLEFEASEDSYLYVLNEDEKGETYVLFPLQGSSVKNPLDAGRLYRLPGAPTGGPTETTGHRHLLWKITSAGGTEHILIIASPARLKEIEGELASVPAAGRPGERTYAQLSETTAMALRGIGGVVERSEFQGIPPASVSRLFDRAKQLAGRAEQARGVWIRQIDLNNPSPQ